MTDRLRVAVLDDHALVRDGLVALLSADGGAGLDVVYAGTDPAAAAHAGPAAALLDIDLGPGAPDVAACVTVLVGAGCGVLLLSALAHPAAVRSGMTAGALGFAPKKATPSMLRDAVRTVAGGEIFLTPELAGVLLADPRLAGLGPRDVEVLRLYSAGLTPGSVAGRLGLPIDDVTACLDRVRLAFGRPGSRVRPRPDGLPAATPPDAPAGRG